LQLVAGKIRSKIARVPEPPPPPPSLSSEQRLFSKFRSLHFDKQQQQRKSFNNNNNNINNDNFLRIFGVRACALANVCHGVGSK